MPESELTLGELAFDTVRRRVGLVIDVQPLGYALRPPGGGIEWDASRKDIRRATTADQLSPALAEINARSRQGNAHGTFARPDTP